MENNIITKICTNCKIEKNVDEFYKKNSKDIEIRYRARCKKCESLIQIDKNMRKKNNLPLRSEIITQKQIDKLGVSRSEVGEKEYYKIRQLYLFYKLSIVDYNKMFEEQNGCCAICGIHQSECKRSLSVDHNHETGKIRSLLCANCNFGIGYFKENLELFKKASDYIKFHKELN